MHIFHKWGQWKVTRESRISYAEFGSFPLPAGFVPKTRREIEQERECAICKLKQLRGDHA